MNARRPSSLVLLALAIVGCHREPPGVSALGDPDHTLSRAQLADKARRLGAYADGATAAEMDAAIARAWRLRDEADVRDWLPAR